MSRTTLDLKGLICPLPVLRANKALRALEFGDEIEVLATDQAAPSDFVAFCAAAGHELVSSVEDDGVYVFVVRKVGSAASPGAPGR